MIELHIFNRCEHEIDETVIRALVQTIWRNEQAGAARVNLIFVNPDYIRRLNRQYLNREYATDVIAFPLSDPEADVYEGEVYICLEQVFENAVSYHVEKEQELKRVVAHGVLHLLGYDDKEVQDRRNMTSRENYYLTER